MSESRYNIKDLINVNQIGRIKFDISGIPLLTKLSVNNTNYDPDNLTGTEFFCPLYNQLYYKKGNLTSKFINFNNTDISSNDLLKKVTNQKIMSDFIKKTFFKEGKNLNFNDKQINEFKKNGNIKIDEKLLLNNALIILNKIILKNKKAIIYYRKPKDSRIRQYYLTSLPFNINNVNIDDINNCPDYSKIKICKVDSSSNRVTIDEVVTKLYEKDKQKIKNKNNEQIKLFKQAFSSNETELTKKLRVLKDQENTNITKSVIIYDLVKKILNKPQYNYIGKYNPTKKLGLLGSYSDILGNADNKKHFENLIERERIRIVDNFKEYKNDKLFGEETFKKYIENIVDKYFEERKKLKNDDYNSSITLRLLLTINNFERIPRSIFSKDAWRERYQDAQFAFKNYKRDCTVLDHNSDYTIKQQEIINNCKLLCGYPIPPHSIVDCSNNHLSCNVCKTFVNCSFGTNIKNQCKTQKTTTHKNPVTTSTKKKSTSGTKTTLLSNLFKIQRPPIKTLKYPTNMIAFGNPIPAHGGKNKTKKTKQNKKTKQKKSYKRHRTIKQYKKYNKRKTYKR